MSNHGEKNTKNIIFSKEEEGEKISENIDKEDYSEEEDEKITEFKFFFLIFFFFYKYQGTFSTKILFFLSAVGQFIV
jgi:hypothetical protein